MERRSWSGRPSLESHDQFGLGFCSVLVSNIPPSVTQRNLRSHFYEATDWTDDPHVRMMSTQAIVTFKSPSCAMDIVRKARTTCNGVDLTVEPYIEVFSGVTAVIPAGLCDCLPNSIIDRLQTEAGVTAIRHSNTLEIIGSLDQIDRAQKLIRQRFAAIINEKLEASSRPHVGGSESSKWNGEYNAGRYMDDQGATGYSHADTDEDLQRQQRGTFARHGDDREIGQGYQTNGFVTSSKYMSEGSSGNERSRTKMRQTPQRSSSLSRLEKSTKTKQVETSWDRTEGPAEIIDKKLDSRSSETSASSSYRPPTQPVLSSKPSNASKSQSSTVRKIKASSNPTLPSKPVIPSAKGTRNAPTGGRTTGTTSARSRNGLQGAIGGVGVSSTTKASRRKAHSTHFYKGVKVSVVHGDLTKERVDVIVSAVGGDLHNRGGVAGAISRAGGPSIQKDCDKYRRKHGPLSTSECMVTGPGGLPCSHVIHAAGPVYQKRHPFRTEEELTKTTVTALMSAAVDLQAQSIALPAISSGTFGVPKDMCARAMLAGIMTFVKSQREISSGLMDIRIVDNDFGTVLTFTSHCQKLFDDSGSSESQKGSRRRSSSMSRAESRSRTSNFGMPSDDSLYIHGASGTTAYRASYNDNDQSLTNIPDETDYFREEKNWDYKVLSGMGVSSQRHEQSVGSKSGDDQQADTCPICMSDFTDPKTLPCSHKFCAECLASALKHAAKCPVCSFVVGKLRGNQPDGSMKCEFDKYSSLPGYPGCGTIIVHYNIPSGVQGPDHPNPGHRYHGTSRTAYLPDNSEGREVLSLLKEAWSNKLIFTIGTSVTTGASDTVTWNDIHHKTNPKGGPTRYGYPDPSYLGRVKEELAAKGIKPKP